MTNGVKHGDGVLKLSELVSVYMRACEYLFTRRSNIPAAMLFKKADRVVLLALKQHLSIETMEALIDMLLASEDFAVRHSNQVSNLPERVSELLVAHLVSLHSRCRELVGNRSDES